MVDSDAAPYNILAVGSALQNSYVDRLSKTGNGLPVRWNPDGSFVVKSVTYRELQNKCVASGFLNDPSGCSYVAIYPNPQNQNNYVLLLPEAYNLGALNTPQITVENCDIFVGYLSGKYAYRKAAIVLPQDWKF